MKIKICGITQEKDIQACEENNANFIGFINIKRSPRFVDLDKINELTGFMKDKDKAVLVIEPKDLNEAENTIRESKISTIQLHSLSSDDIKTLKQKNLLNTSLTIIKAVGIPEKIDKSKKNEIEEYAEVCDFLLFDSQIKGKTGGTGKQIPFKQAIEAAEISKTVNEDIKLILAGGINAEMIKIQGKVIETVFDCVDVNSGVEDHPGLKNQSKIKEFMQIVKIQEDN